MKFAKWLKIISHTEFLPEGIKNVLVKDTFFFQRLYPERDRVIGRHQQWNQEPIFCVIMAAVGHLTTVFGGIINNIRRCSSSWLAYLIGPSLALSLSIGQVILLEFGA